MMFAAMHPERVDRLVLVASFPRGTPGAASRIADETEATWGTGRALRAIWFKGAPESLLPELGRYERAMGSPRAIADLMRHAQDLDARSLAPTIRVPTRVIHARDDPIVSFTNAEWLAANIPDAELVAIDGDFHGSANTEELDLLLDPVIEFAAGESVPAEVSAERVLAAVLFNDIIDSTGQATELGDQRWSQRLDALEHTAQAVVRRHRGRWVKSTGDGVLATFDGPAAAVRAGLEIRDQATNLGLTLRTGVHFGEIERRGDDIGGLGVHIAARVMASADDDEIWVSSTVPGLTVGSLLKFEPRGQHELKGIDGRWDLHAASS